MKNASQLLKDHLKYFGKDPSKWENLFASDAFVEFSLPVRKLDEFKVIGVQIYAEDDSSTISADYEVEVKVIHTREKINQRYICFFKSEGGKITFFSEKENNLIF